ncbi:PAS domain S-box protein [Thauera sp. UPWRP]|nr:PAS domain S-box protein [Thauera sp. UPWRP]
MARSPSPQAEPAAFTPEQLRRHDLLLAGLDLFDQAIAVFDTTPKLVTWNKALVRLLDFPEALVRVGTPFEAFVRFNAERGEYGEGDIERLVAQRMAAARAFQPHYVERARPNGTVLAVRGVPIPNLGFVSLWTDITEQRRAEALIQEQNAQLEARVRERTAELEQTNAEKDQIAAALRRSEHRLQLIVDSIPALIAYVDRAEIYHFANRGYAEWFGYTKDEIVGRSIHEVLGDETYGQILPQVDRARRGERVCYEYSRTGPQGRIVHARSVIVPETGADGDIVGFFVMSTDITEQKASQAARRGAELIRRLLSFSRRQTLEPSAIEVGSLVHNMTHLLVRTLGETIKVRLRLPGEPLHAFVDPHQLENAILNLALNARDAMPDGGELTIAVTQRTLDAALARAAEVQPGDYVQIDVSDSGSGIDAAVLPRVFEPFFTTKPFGGGSGLGLSMVYGFVRQSGGNVRILSAPNKGTNVRFVLPMAAAPAPAPAAAPVARSAPPLRDGPVLLVEDEPEVRKVIRMQLTTLGHPVIEAADGVEALELLEHVEDIAILVSDTVMPGGLGGPELAARARELRPGLPVLLITGYASEGTDMHSPAGVPVLRKPFDTPALADALAHLQEDLTP